MVVQWVPSQLTAHEYAKVQHLIPANERLEGGAVTTTRYELMENDHVVATTHALSLSDAVVHFNHMSRTPPASVPAHVIQNVQTAIVNDLACNCVTPTCQSIECLKNSIRQGLQYIAAYSTAGAMPTMTVRTPSRVYHLALTFTPNAHPTLDDVRHGVLGRLQVHSLTLPK